MLSLVSLLAIAGCSNIERVQMAQSPALARVVPMQVTQASFPAWKAPLSFGSWRTQGSYKDTERARCRDSLLTSKVSRSGRFRFALAAPRADQQYPPGQVLQAECVTTNRTTIYRALADIQADADGYPQLQCTFTGLGTGKLEIQKRRGQPEIGSATFGESAWTVRSVGRSDSGAPSLDRPFGYEILMGDDVVAAVETINRGRVWITPAAGDDVRLAALATALLLYDPRDADLEQDCE
jgi:hypothetical protein